VWSRPWLRQRRGRPDPTIDDLWEAYEKFVADMDDNPSHGVREAAADTTAELRPKLDDLVKKALDVANLFGDQ